MISFILGQLHAIPNGLTVIIVELPLWDGADAAPIVDWSTVDQTIISCLCDIVAAHDLWVSTAIYGTESHTSIII